MEYPTLVIDTQTGTVVSADASAERRLGAPGTGINGLRLDALLPGIGMSDSGHTPKWMRFADGRRQWVLPVVCALPGETRSVLVLTLAPASTLDADMASLAQPLLDQLERGAPLRDDALTSLCAALLNCLDLALVRAVATDHQPLELAVAGNPAIADTVRSATRLSAESTVLSDSRRQVLPTLMHDAPRPLCCDPSFASVGVRCAAAWPIDGNGHSFVLELYAYGDHDLEDSPTAELLATWIGKRLTHALQRQRQALLADALTETVTPAFVTDHEGVIVWVNRAFTRQYGYPPETAIGQTPRILHSGEHGERYYRGLWAAILGGHAWSGRTVDRAADGRLFTVRQSITPLLRHGRPTHFLAIHSDISDDAQLASLADAIGQTDVLSGLLTWSAFDEQAGQALLGASLGSEQPTFMLVAVRSRSGVVPQLDAQAQAAVLAELGERIRSGLPETCLAASLGGYDFAALLPAGADADLFKQSLIDSLCAPLPLLGDTLDLQCSSACARYPDDGSTIDELRKAADRRLADGA